MKVAVPVAGINPFKWVKDQVLGGLEWGIEEAAGFVTNLLAGIADALVPDWVAKQATNLIGWTVSVPNYAASGDGIGGYAFGGLNSLRGVLTWVGVTLVPLTLTVSVGRAAIGLSGHPIAPIQRVLVSVALVLFYPLAWGQVASATNVLTHALLAAPAVERGINSQFEWIVGGGALKGVPLLGSLMLLVGAVLLIAVMVLKIAIVVVGAVLYVTGVLMPGIAATERGYAVGQAWITATVGLMAIPVLWTVVFAVAALLVHDAPTAASAVGGSGKLRELIGGLTLAVGSIAALAVCIKVTTFLGSVVMGQVSGTLALVSAGNRGPASGGPGGVARAVDGKLSAFGSRVGGALRQVAGDRLSGRARSGALAALGAGSAVASGGVAGVAAAGARRAAGTGAQAARRVAHRAPAGAVASRIARSARAGWDDPKAAPRWGTPTRSASDASQAPKPPDPPASEPARPQAPSPEPPPTARPTPPSSSSSSAPSAAAPPQRPPSSNPGQTGSGSSPARRPASRRPSSSPPDKPASSPAAPDRPPPPDQPHQAADPPSGGPSTTPDKPDSKGGPDADLPPSR